MDQTHCYATELATALIDFVQSVPRETSDIVIYIYISMTQHPGRPKTHM
jgi:hypothetical protein